MTKSDPSTLLRQQIQFKETELISEEKLLKEHIHLMSESLKPVNLIKSVLKDPLSDHFLKTEVVNTAMGITSGFLAKKVFAGNSHNLLVKLWGGVLQMVVATGVMKKADKIKSMAAIVFKRIMKKPPATAV